MLRLKQAGMAWILAMCLAACGGAPESAQQAAPAMADSAAMPEAAAADTAASDPNQLLDSAVLGQKVAGRQLVVAADLMFETDNVRQSTAALEQLAVRYGGFVQRSQIETDDYGRDHHPQSDGTVLVIRRYVQRADVQVRVPRAKAADFIRDVQQQIRFLNQQAFSATDVSLDLRRQALEAARQHALSQRLDEVAAASEPGGKRDTGRLVQQQFDARAAEEYARLQQAYWQDQVDFATIRLQFSQPEAVYQERVNDVAAVLREHQPGFWASVGHMLKQGWYGLLQTVLWLVAAWPLWLIPVVAWMVYRGYRRRHAGRHAQRVDRYRQPRGKDEKQD